jgi:hypothetical protein
MYSKKYFYVGFEVLKAMVMKGAIFWQSAEN